MSDNTSIENQSTSQDLPPELDHVTVHSTAAGEQSLYSRLENI